jgi:hypothetical protein
MVTRLESKLFEGVVANVPVSSTCPGIGGRGGTGDGCLEENTFRIEDLNPLFRSLRTSDAEIDAGLRVALVPPGKSSESSSSEGCETGFLPLRVNFDINDIAIILTLGSSHRYAQKRSKSWSGRADCDHGLRRQLLDNKAKRFNLNSLPTQAVLLNTHYCIVVGEQTSTCHSVKVCVWVGG